ncbi:hypothetical protein PAAG_09123 [Paracoccidioides lutzii Pb01]|uniref:Cytochrome b5 heme-binding domain-containing protein n=1 Tax=Paracoccidioides lutzii (strain ATCC MYA-826 / Pb01) TaxID=502779 RepID=C1HED4_PARBA|nr:hypothetical protein PAAG_09123 [Paracoccidioides lutzii Pb01]EEH41743.2 hypothetical protein PAAG_09123 [Paracoccidioides lutzii Pb01]
MGWVGVGALVASISFLLYKRPLGSWNLGPLHELLRNTLGIPILLQDNSSSYQPPPKTESIQSEYGLLIGEFEDSGGRTYSRSGDSTPKATLMQPLSIDVPILNFEESPASIEILNKTYPVQGSLPSPATISETFPSLETRNVTTKNALMGPPRLPPPKAQTQNTSKPKPKSTSMLPPSRPSLNVSPRPPQSAASSLCVPVSRGLTSSTLGPAQIHGKTQPSRQVKLEPGHSPLDWAAISSNPNHKLRGENLPPTLIHVTPSMLREHNGKKGQDAWTSYLGKVYNITPYLPFHPGGKGELLRGAGRNSEKLFSEIHPWVNWDGMLGECMVGILVSEDYKGSGSGGGLEEMD